MYQLDLKGICLNMHILSAYNSIANRRFYTMSKKQNSLQLISSEDCSHLKISYLYNQVYSHKLVWHCGNHLVKFEKTASLVITWGPWKHSVHVLLYMNLSQNIRINNLQLTMDHSVYIMTR